MQHLIDDVGKITEFDYMLSVKDIIKQKCFLTLWGIFNGIYFIFVISYLTSTDYYGSL